MSRGCVSRLIAAFAIVTLGGGVAAEQSPAGSNRSKHDAEVVERFQALLRLDTSNPPGNERVAIEYLEQVLESEGVQTETFALEASRPNLVARVRGNGKKRPLLLMGHTDVVTVDPKKWTFPPFSATRDGGYIYGRGALDDKPSVVAGLMTILRLKRENVPLDRDVVFLAEAGEEGTTRVGIDFMANEHFDAIAAEYCLAEGGGVERDAGRERFASVAVLEKLQRPVELVAHGTAGHGSVPLESNAIGRLAAAVNAVVRWQPPIRLNETTREYFTRLASISTPEVAQQLRALLSADRQAQTAAVDYLRGRHPDYVSMLRTSVSPTVIQGGFRFNVIPSEAKATLDVRLLPDEDPATLLDRIRAVVNDPNVEVRLLPRDGAPRPPGGTGLDTEAFRVIQKAVTDHYRTITLPTMSTGGSDKAQMRAKGVQCYGIGPATDREDASKGFGAHSDQERILERELIRFVDFTWDVVTALAGAR